MLSREIREGIDQAVEFASQVRSQLGQLDEELERALGEVADLGGSPAEDIADALSTARQRREDADAKIEQLTQAVEAYADERGH